MFSAERVAPSFSAGGVVGFSGGSGKDSSFLSTMPLERPSIGAWISSSVLLLLQSITYADIAGVKSVESAKLTLTLEKEDLQPESPPPYGSLPVEIIENSWTPSGSPTVSVNNPD